jgi:hypothetical protein
MIATTIMISTRVNPLLCCLFFILTFRCGGVNKATGGLCINAMRSRIACCQPPKEQTTQIEVRCEAARIQRFSAGSLAVILVPQKIQAPNIKLQRNTKIQIPKSHLLRCLGGLRKNFNLIGWPEYLKVEIWSFSGAWILIPAVFLGFGSYLGFGS